MATAAVVCVALMVLLWPRLGGPGIRPVLGRLMAIGVTQSTIVATLALAVNSSYQFYGSWSELFGNNSTAPVGVTAAQGGTAGNAIMNMRTSGSALVQPGATSVLRQVSGLPTGPADMNGRVDSVNIIGKLTGVRDPAFVYLPPQYFQKSYAQQRFPVIVALSGYPGSIYNVAQNLRVTQTNMQLMQQGVMQPTVIVMIRPTLAPPRDTECVNVPGGPQTETFLAQDLPYALKQAYRIGHDPSAWGVMGYSAGATCALQLTMRNPGVYTSAVALSPEYAIKEDPTTGNLFGTGPARMKLIEEHNLMWRLKHLPIPQVSVLVANSKQGEKGYPQTLAFLKAAKAPMRTQAIFPNSGSHNFPTWVREMPAAMHWMAQQLIFPQDLAPRQPASAGTSHVRALPAPPRLTGGPGQTAPPPVGR
jgi:hypothetical protein